MFLKVPLDFGHIHPLQLGNGMGFKYPWGLGVWVFKGMGGGTEYQTRGTPGGTYHIPQPYPSCTTVTYSQ